MRCDNPNLIELYSAILTSGGKAIQRRYAFGWLIEVNERWYMWIEDR